jgi:Mg-chelatase subunit ChlD
VRSAAALLAIGLGLPATCGASVAVASVQSRPRVEVAFVLDTTGSMGGLIDGAKRRIWSIAPRIGEWRPRPDVRIALVAYRDKGDEYVTRVFDLTGDMDEVYRNLMSLQAGGGGDTPEHVSAAIHDAVHKVSWSEGPALRVLFLVGDAPPHVDYQDGFDYRRHVREARQRGIGVETIECGADPETARVWQEMAALGEGHFARIDSNGGMPVRVTPVDEELARLGTELGTTVVAAGNTADRTRTAGRLAARAAMPAAMAVEAAGYFASADHLAEKDLVDLPAPEQKKEIEALRRLPAEAPTTLAGKGDAEALAYLQKQKERRQQIQTRITALQAQRDGYLSRGTDVKDGFDEQVLTALRSRAKATGIAY